jgi:uncharacterized protein YacL
MTHHPNEPAKPVSPSNTISIIGIVAGALALLLPIVFGPAGLILGVMARTRNERLANVALLLAAVGMVVGLLVAFLASASK